MSAQCQVKLPKNALQVFIKRYSLRDEHGQPVESVSEVFQRVARVVSEAENLYRDGIKPEEIRQEFFDNLCQLRFIPNGRTLANAGTSYGQLANCFVLPVEDDLGRMENSIFNTLRNAVLILQTGGGVGFSFGRLRHKGARISTSKGKATGAVSFLKIYDTAFWVIGQGGGRRSACMAVLPVDHPDVEDFIKCKEIEGEIEHFNISVGLTDEFMQAVEADKVFYLRDPHNQEKVRSVKARKLFSKIATYAHHNGEPGVLFLDTANKDNPVAKQYQLEATNPCGEQWLGPGENCCMASINLREHVKLNSKLKTQNSKLFPYKIDWEKLRQTTENTVRFLDDVVDANKYVPSVPLLQEAALKNRRIGVSIMGLADMFYLLGVAYGSREAEDVASQVMEFIRFYSLKASVELARQRGSFPGIVDSVYDKNDFQFKVPKSMVKTKQSLARPELNWSSLIKDIKKHGIRNAAQNTIAPTGAIATITGLEGYGCEPVFSLSYVMKTHEGIENISKKNQTSDFVNLYYESQLFKNTLKRAGLSKNKREKIFTQIRKTGSCQASHDIPEEIRRVFVVSSDLKASQHIRMQAALQRFVDNSISKTVNFPATATVAEVEEAYLLAWKLGCKGTTVYVTGSRSQVVLESGRSEKDKTTPYATNGESDFRGKPLFKQRPGETAVKQSLKAVCPECGFVMIKGEGCMTCPKCGYSKCDV